MIVLSFNTILHPTDFSPRSEYALRMAEALARDHNAELVLLHVVEPAIIGFGEGVVPPKPEESLELAREKLGQIRPNDPKVPVKHILREGTPIEEILRVCKETKADLIVMGTHGRTGLSRLLLGSVAELVLRQASCPVLTVKGGTGVACETEKQETGQPLGIS